MKNTNEEILCCLVFVRRSKVSYQPTWESGSCVEGGNCLSWFCTFWLKEEDGGDEGELSRWGEVDIARMRVMVLALAL